MEREQKIIFATSDEGEGEGEGLRAEGEVSHMMSTEASSSHILSERYVAGLGLGSGLGLGICCCLCSLRPASSVYELCLIPLQPEP